MPRTTSVANSSQAGSTTLVLAVEQPVLKLLPNASDKLVKSVFSIDNLVIDTAVVLVDLPLSP